MKITMIPYASWFGWTIGVGYFVFKFRKHPIPIFTLLDVLVPAALAGWGAYSILVADYGTRTELIWGTSLSDGTYHPVNIYKAVLFALHVWILVRKVNVEKIAEVVQSYLQREGYEVDIVGSGEEGISSHEEKPYDLILLDLMLPGIPGEETCKRLRSLSRVSIIMLTAKTSEQDKIEGLCLGADDYVTKPFSLGNTII
ncbi:response regulator [Effusibacillus lacus]|nr:response regulator [Effusibacillus lacus]TCS74979.1 response regulator receiver domain-containing protein [Effusibacillus lacus]